MPDAVAVEPISREDIQTIAKQLACKFTRMTIIRLQLLVSRCRCGDVAVGQWDNNVNGQPSFCGVTRDVWLLFVCVGGTLAVGTIFILLLRLREEIHLC